MSRPTDIEVSRALNALVTTLNEQGARGADPGRWQEIVTGSLAGERHILVIAEPGDGLPRGRLEAPDGRRLASFDLRAGRWVATREGSPLSGAYIPR